MRLIRATAVLALVLVATAGLARAEEPAEVPQAAATEAPATEASAAAAEADAEEMTWEFSIYASTYLVPDSRDYVQPTVGADRGWLHLEGRYNYESLDAGSVWAGYNFSVGEKVVFEATPMLGCVFGDTTGIAPGYELSLTWRKLALYSEGELVFDTGNSDDSFLYNWSELSVAPVPWCRLGVVAQRTRAYETDVDIQRGLLVGFSWKDVEVTAYAFGLDQDEPTWVLSAGVSF